MLSAAFAKVAELADALDSGSSGVTLVRVQLPPFALKDLDTKADVASQELPPLAPPE